jgi:hypothetical protein
MPGQILGQATEDVYDSVSGRLLLIPPGSKLIGAYDSQVPGAPTHGSEALEYAAAIQAHLLKLMAVPRAPFREAEPPKARFVPPATADRATKRT